MAYRFLILIYLVLYASNQCLAMEDSEKRTVLARISDEVTDDNKVKWVEKQTFNILAAEDEPISALLLKHLFKGENKIVVFGNGKDLLNEIKRLNNSLPSFIITDGHMPILDGWETIENLNTIENCPPIFALAASNEEEKQRFLKLNISAFIPKPANKKTLFSAIYDVFHSLEKGQGE